MDIKTNLTRNALLLVELAVASIITTTVDENRQKNFILSLLLLSELTSSLSYSECNSAMTDEHFFDNLIKENFLLKK